MVVLPVLATVAATSAPLTFSLTLSLLTVPPAPPPSWIATSMVTSGSTLTAPAPGISFP